MSLLCLSMDILMKLSHKTAFKMVELSKCWVMLTIISPARVFAACWPTVEVSALWFTLCCSFQRHTCVGVCGRLRLISGSAGCSRRRFICPFHWFNTSGHGHPWASGLGWLQIKSLNLLCCGYLLVSVSFQAGSFVDLLESSVHSSLFSSNYTSDAIQLFIMFISFDYIGYK